MSSKHFKFVFFLTFVFFFIVGNSGIAQEKKTTDSEKIASIHWNVKNIRKGIKLKTANINLFDSQQAIFIVQIDTARAKVNYFVGMADKLATTSAQASAKNAIIAINGSYFNMQEGYSCNFVKIDHAVAAQTEEKEFNTRGTGIFTVTNNRIDISTWSKEKEKEGAASADCALSSGPLVVDDGKDMEMWDNAFVYNRHPRSFAAFCNGRLLLVAVDGRAPGRAEGMNLIEVRSFARALGCTDVINLDGGGSTTLYVKGKSVNGVVNKPSGGSERPVKSIVYITTDQK